VNDTSTVTIAGMIVVSSIAMMPGVIQGHARELSAVRRAPGR
jgi:hypothetical protein